METNDHPPALQQLAEIAADESVEHLEPGSISEDAYRFLVKVFVTEIQALIERLSSDDLLVGYYLGGGR